MQLGVDRVSLSSTSSMHKRLNLIRKEKYLTEENIIVILYYMLYHLPLAWSMRLWKI